MISIFSVFAFIVLLFFVLLAAKARLRFKFCVLCASVFVTWLGLLAAYFAGWWGNVVLLAIFMGGSAVGIMYVLEKKLPQEFDIFRLPFYLSAVAIVLFVLTGGVLELKIVALLAALWITLTVFYVLKNKSTVVKKIAERLIACCRDW